MATNPAKKLDFYATPVKFVWPCCLGKTTSGAHTLFLLLGNASYHTKDKKRGLTEFHERKDNLKQAGLGDRFSVGTTQGLSEDGQKEDLAGQRGHWLGALCVAHDGGELLLDAKPGLATHAGRAVGRPGLRFGGRHVRLR